MRRTIFRGMLAATLLLTQVGADKPTDATKAAFETIYGSKVRSATTPAAKVALAKQLTTAAASTTADRPLQHMMLTRAWELGKSDPTGYATALEAMRTLATEQPEFQDEAEQHQGDVLEMQARSGPRGERPAAAKAGAALLLNIASRREARDDLDGAESAYVHALALQGGVGAGTRTSSETCLGVIRAVRAARKHAAALTKTLADHPDDAKAAADFVQVQVFELDKPAAALPYLAAAGTLDLTRHVTLATKPVASLKDVEDLDMARWYKAQTAKGGDAAKAVAAGRRRRYFAAFVKLHAFHDADWLEAKSVVDEPVPLSILNPAVIAVHVIKEQQESYEGQSANFARYKDFVFDVGIGPYPDGWGYGMAGIEIRQVHSITVTVEPGAKPFAKQNMDSFAGFFVDYHSKGGYAKRVALAVGPLSDQRGADPKPQWGANRRPDQFVDLGLRETYQLNLSTWAPPDWDGGIWFSAVVENTGMNSAMHARIVSAEGDDESPAATRSVFDEK